MKIQCDVCDKHHASVFCTADEAVLCDGCDHCIHHANKLAFKHQRFSLLRPRQHPLCDVCQERRAFTFCQQDRAILCRECDVSIHSANEHTLKHDRFLLTGVKLSASSSSQETPSPSNSAPDSLFDLSHQKTIPLSSTVSEVGVEAAASTGASSISEYLTETLPGWQVEDFLDSYSVPYGFWKSDEVLSRFDGDMESHLDTFSIENVGIWVPQPSSPLLSSSQMNRAISQTKTTSKVAN